MCNQCITIKCKLYYIVGKFQSLLFLIMSEKSENILKKHLKYYMYLYSTNAYVTSF